MNSTNSEFFQSLELLEKEKGIPKDYMLEKINQALLAALRKDNPGAEENVEVVVDEAKGKIDMFIRKTVVEEIENPAIELLPDEAKRFSKRAHVGDVVNVPVDTKKFGRIAAQAAKQVIIQGIREAERSMVYEQFTSKEHEILTGTVTHIDPVRGSAALSISSSSEFTEAVLTAGERVPTEELREGDKIKVYVVEVRKLSSGPQILISRTHPGLVKRLFELEVPEIYDGTVEIKSIAREAGSRTKMAVWSSDPAVEPIGSCIGPRGGRVSACGSKSAANTVQTHSRIRTAKNMPIRCPRLIGKIPSAILPAPVQRQGFAYPSRCADMRAYRSCRMPARSLPLPHWSSDLPHAPGRSAGH